MSCTTEEPDAGSRIEFADSRVQRAFAALELLAAADVESMNRADLDAVVKARRDVIAFSDSVEVRIARRSRQLAAEGRSEPAADVLREGGRRSAREAAAAAGREKACEQLPSFETALADGAVSSGHLNVLANATAKLDERGQSRVRRPRSRTARRGPPLVGRTLRTILPRPRPHRRRRRRLQRARTATTGEPDQALDRPRHRDGPHPQRTRPRITRQSPRRDLRPTADRAPRATIVPHQQRRRRSRRARR